MQCLGGNGYINGEFLIIPIHVPDLFTPLIRAALSLNFPIDQSWPFILFALWATFHLRYYPYGLCTINYWLDTMLTFKLTPFNTFIRVPNGPFPAGRQTVCCWCWNTGNSSHADRSRVQRIISLVSIEPSSD